jgi:hypothetical protein
MLQWNSSTDFASRECLGLHFQIDFRINVRGIERNVTQPGADGVNVHAGTEKMGRRCMTNSMRTDALCRKRRYPTHDSLNVSLHCRVDAKAGYGPTTSVQKYIIR